MVSGFDAQVKQSISSGITTPFERKYKNSGHDLFSVQTPDLSGVVLKRIG
jgi:hypothetical protein